MNRGNREVGEVEYVYKACKQDNDENEQEEEEEVIYPDGSFDYSEEHTESMEVQEAIGIDSDEMENEDENDNEVQATEFKRVQIVKVHILNLIEKYFFKALC